MPNKNYQRGRRLEWDVKKHFEGRGFHVIRAAGSHSAYDLVAAKQGLTHTDIRFIQCKVVKKLTAGILNKLKAEVLQTSPLQFELDSIEINVDVVLAVKEHGKGAFALHYPLEP